MKLLKQITKGRRQAARRTLLYGTHGIGKSTFASMAPNPVFIPTEDGLGEIDCHAFPLARTYFDVRDAIAELYSQDHQYQTITLDSLDWLERLIWQHVCSERGVSNIEDIGFAKGYAFALSYWREVLDGLDALRNGRGMNVVLLAHARIERFEHPEVDSFDRFVPRLHKSASHLVQEWADEVLFASYKVYTRSTDEGFNKKRAKGLGTGERVIRTSERPSHVAKNRLNLPDELPLSWNAYAQFFSSPVSLEESVHG